MRKPFTSPAQGLHVIGAGDQVGERHAVAENLAVIGEASAQVGLVDGIGFGVEDRVAASSPVGERRQDHLANIAAEAFECLGGRRDGLPSRGIGRVVVLVKMADEANAEPRDGAL